jgi:hypothetical protein
MGGKDDVTYGSFIKDLEDEDKEQEQKINTKKYESNRMRAEDKLSKDDLEPFFEKNK